MTTIHIIARVVLLAILFIAILHLGGAAAWADRYVRASGSSVQEQTKNLAERYCRIGGFPHNDFEACQMVMQVFQ